MQMLRYLAGDSLPAPNITASNAETDPHDALRLLPLQLAELYGRPPNFQERWEVIRAINSLSTILRKDGFGAAWTWCREMTPDFVAMIRPGSGAAMVVVAANWAVSALRSVESPMSWILLGLADMMLDRVLQFVETIPGLEASCWP
jgi:hypothetical protein